MRSQSKVHLFFAAIPAHGAPQDTQSRAGVKTDVTIIIEVERAQKIKPRP